MSDSINDYKIQQIERELSEMRQAFKSIDESLKRIVILDERMAQLLIESQTQKAEFKELTEKIDKIEDRISERILHLEKEIPGIRLVTKYVIVGAVGIIAAVGAAILKTVGLK